MDEDRAGRRQIERAGVEIVKSSAKYHDAFVSTPKTFLFGSEHSNQTPISSLSPVMYPASVVVRSLN